jgi:ankyrin repeat protein
MFLYLIVNLKGFKMLAANVKNYGSTQSTGIENRGYVNHAFDFSQDVATSNGRDIKTSAVTENAKLAKQAIDNVDPLILELRKAIDNNDINLIKRKVKENPKVINQISPDFCRNRTNATLLIYAIDQNRLEVVKELIASGADVDAVVGKKKITAIYEAALLKDTSILELLLKKSSMHINTCSTSGWYPLHCAVKAGNLDAIKLLISYGADTNVYTRYSIWNMTFGETPLSYAVSRGYVKIVECLLENQADVNKGTISVTRKRTVVQAMCCDKDFFVHADLVIPNLKETKYEMLAVLVIYGAKLDQGTINTIMGS